MLVQCCCVLRLQVSDNNILPYLGKERVGKERVVYVDVGFYDNHIG